MENISQNVNIEMLEKLPDGTYKRKYPKTRADDGTTFDEHLADSTHIPTGLISMWSGLIVNIPNGWALCDGTNGTPNLKDRFIMGAITDVTINKTGGANTVALTTSQMPSHSHSSSMNSAGSHTHTNSNNIGTEGSFNANRMAVSATGTAGNTLGMSSNGAHTHTVTIGDTGSGQAHENRPAYFTLAFIMKI